MALTESERFHFDLAGFLVRPAILEDDQIEAIVDQIDHIKHDPESLSPECRATPGGPSSVLIDHPRVIDVLHDLIGPDIRLETSKCVWRMKGEAHGNGLHAGGPQQADPIFGYRVNNGRIHAGMVRVVFELTNVGKNDGGTNFIVGSHKANFPMHSDHMSLEMEKRSPFLMSYDCPAGSAVFFTENLCHTGPAWRGEAPRVAVLHAYAHLGTQYHRLELPSEVLESLPREKQAYFRPPWLYDFRTKPATPNTMERFVSNDEEMVSVEDYP